jgi:photosystem II stability/assembly factor-like uncharacterized protein
MPISIISTMKLNFTKLILILIFTMHMVNAEAQCEWKTPMQVGSTYNFQNMFDVFFITAKQGWAVCDGGTILTTSSGGITWSAQTSGTIQTLYSVHFASDTQGWAVGYGGTILSTNNGGSTWITQVSGTTQSLHCVYFISATQGWAVGNGGTILSTSNGGSTWTEQTSSIINQLNSIFFISVTQGWAVGNGGTILSTSNGGSTWTAQTSGTTQNLHSVNFTSATQGWAVGQNGTIRISNNGGSSWSAQISGAVLWLNSVHFISDTQGWAVGSNGMILSTSNGGNTWTSQTSGTTQVLNSVYFTSATQGWAVGIGGTIHTTSNGGSTWTAQTSGIANALSSVFFTSATQGWAVGNGGTILNTSNGGSTWAAQTTGIANTLNSVFFTSDKQGWVVGSAGTILRTSNGGSSWTSQISGTSLNLRSVSFTSATQGWSVGQNGTIRTTNNGGIAWTAQTSGTTQWLYSVFFTSALQGWAVGQGGTIRTTSNGGNTWTTQTSGITQTLYCVYFTSDTQGWAVGGGGTILSTSNGGNTWTVQTSGTTQVLNSVYFTSATQGWVVGDGGTILSTNNGGSTWKTQTSGIINQLTSLYFITATQGWAVGSPGTILLWQCPAPKINVKGNNLSIADGDITTNLSDNTDFGIVVNGAQRTFKIFNTGTNIYNDTLKISSSSVTGAHASDFTISGMPTKINAGDSALFTVTFNSSGSGIRNATITINNNDTSKAAYDFAIQAIPSTVEIDIKGNNISIADGDITPSLSDNTDFGIVANGTQNSYKIFNFGTDTLKITGSSITGTHAADFTISVMPTKIIPGDSAMFTVTFTTSDSGVRNATITINSNDTSKAVYDFAIQAVLSTLEIDIKGNNLSITDGDITPSLSDSTDFGIVANGTKRSYKIFNLGTDTLKIISSSVTGAHATDFTISGIPTIVNAGDSAMFIVTFNSSGSGIRSATITINNNDTSKTAYDFAIQAIPSTVDINIKGNNLSITDGDITPSLSDSTDFGIVVNRTQRSYKIFNTGTDTLKISSSSITGTHASDFTISGMPTKINAGDSAMFTVTFNTSDSGVRNATITINSNDTSKAAYDFAIQAVRTTVKIDIKGNNQSIADGDITPSLSDSTDFGIVANGTKRRYKIFNSGTDTLKISSSSVTGTHAADFTISVMPTVINAGDSAMFTVIFNSIGSGIRSANITINSNDTSKAAYDFAIQAILSTVDINIKGNNLNITDGDVRPSLSDSTDYGIVANGTKRSYKIFNSGTDTLKIIGSSVTGAHAADFAVSGMPTKINAGDSAMFTVTFNTSNSGVRNATITINSNDTSKAAYEFAIQAVLSTVDIDIKGNNQSIADGDITPSLSDSTDFGIVVNRTQRSYKIFNTGTDTLKISSSSVTGTHASDFTISGMPTKINAGDSAMFTVTFTPSGSGIRSATITINNNDTSKAAYDFAIQAILSTVKLTCKRQ